MLWHFNIADNEGEEEDCIIAAKSWTILKQGNMLMLQQNLHDVFKNGKQIEIW